MTRYFPCFPANRFDTQIAMMRAGLLSDQDSADGLVTLLNSYFDQSHAAGWYLAKLHAKRVSALSEREIEEAFDNVAGDPVAPAKFSMDATTSSTPPAQARSLSRWGAAHLHGSDGVLAQLQGAGYRLSRQEF